uniref:RING-type domain-containing protein n=1 Tax=Haemonchus contortus TaxID=6289 RepID=A0A7I4Y950_HAECO
MSTPTSARGGGRTMTWASSRRLVITNDVPQIVVGNGSPRSHERASSNFSAPSYSIRGTSNQNTSRGGFQPSRGAATLGYTPRGVSTAQRGGTSCYAWRGSTTSGPIRGTSVPVTTYYRGTNMCQTRPAIYTRNTTTAVHIPNSSGGRQVIPDPNAPKIFPMTQAMPASAQFVEGLPPTASMPYPFQVRRMVNPIQPVIARRDVRFSTPTPIMISKRGPLGVSMPCGGAGVSVETSRPQSAQAAGERDEVAADQNRGDSEGDEEDGRTSPDVLSTSIRSNEDTWDFWDRVYSDPELRQSMQERQRDSPMAELLHSDKLCKAQVVFLNVPRLAYGQQHVVRSLIHREINSNLPILDIHITYRKWTVRFYRSEDAVQVLRHFNGFSFRNHKLLVRACQNNSSFGDVTSLEEAAQQENEERRSGFNASPEGQRHDHDPLWTLTEWKDIMEFKKDLMGILEGKQTGMVLTEALNEAAVSQRRGFVSAAAELWPTGLIRILLPEVKAIGRCVCLAGHEDMAALVRRAAQEGTPRLMTDSWEPIPPCEIRTEQHLLSYLAAFLGHFGPQHIIIDIPLRLLLKSLSGNWPTTGQALAEWATKRSYQFIVMFEVLYLASSIRHRRILVEAVQPLSSLKFKFLNSTARC